MITASSSKQFLLRIPIGFVPDEIEQKYYPYLSQRFSIYPNLTEYLNAHVQKVNLIPMTARQHISQTDQLHPYGRDLRDAKHPFTFTSGDITITFKMDSSYIIWAILNEILVYYNTKFEKKFAPNFLITLTDAYGAGVIEMICEDNILNHVSTQIAIDYSTNALETRSIEFSIHTNCITQDYVYATQSDDNLQHYDDRYIS